MRESSRQCKNSQSDVKIAKDTTYEEKRVSQKGCFFWLRVGQAGGLDPLWLLLRKM